MKSNWIRISCASVLACLGAALSVQAASLTVNPDGSGDFTTIQAAVDASAEGDVIVIAAGEYTEDVAIGDLNGAMPNLKNNITLRAETTGTVTINAANASNRVQALAGLGVGFGPADKLGVFVNGEGVTFEGIRFVQSSDTPNELEAAPFNSAMTIISANATLRDCEIVGPGSDVGGDLLGVLLANLDPISLQAGTPNLGQNLTLENCTFSNAPFAFAMNNFLLALGVPAPNPTAAITGSTFENNGTGIEMDDGDCTVTDSVFRANGTGISCSDDNITVSNCEFTDNVEYGFEIETGDIEDDEPAGSPVAVIENSMFMNNGFDEGSYGIMQEGGTLTLRNTIIAGSASANLFLKPDDEREVTASMVNCDLYNSQLGVGVTLVENPEAVITLSILNTNIVDFDGIDNLADAVAEINASFSNIFASNQQYIGDEVAFTSENLLNVDPDYVDPANGDFRLSDASPVLTAGENGTFIGALGAGGTNIADWSLR